MKIGILAYGSLIGDPGEEIGPLIRDHIPACTPFPVEYARISKTRGGAPTVVPHTSGKPVAAEILVLSSEVSLDEAKSMLWRRERRKESSGEKYQRRSTPNAVFIEDAQKFHDIEHVLYTNFNTTGKISSPDPYILAEAAVKSVSKAARGMDGISYLIDLTSKGVITELTEKYKAEILTLTQSSDLTEALQKTISRLTI